MKKLSANQIRTMWLSFFKTKGHHFLEPVSLIPVNDPSLLWINSGVATLKPYFEGRLIPPASRLTNSQKAIRTNDIENVGVTARHQTMFEMLGNFSIGDYFKEDALTFAWELLTSPKWFAIDPKKLYITVFNEDEETYKLWREKIGIRPDHIFKMGKKTNFWEVGAGPAGPNTEIFFDRGPQWDSQNLGTKLITEDIENDRYVEIWNIVFSQFSSDGKGHYRDLPRKNIDTGAGLERLASIFQDTPTNFETDLFLPVIKQLESLTASDIQYSLDNYLHPKAPQTKINTAFKVIADHLRAVSFAISEGILPSNKDRGYVVRRLIRRAQLYAFELGLKKTFLSQLVDASIAPMKAFYPELHAKRDLIKSTIHEEEVKFLKTLTKGYKHLQHLIATEKKLTAKNTWLLFESYGFPMELTKELAQQQNVPIDIEGVKKLRDQAKALSRQARSKVNAWNKESAFYSQIDTPSQFTGWSELKRENAKVNLLFKNDTAVKQLENEIGFIILDKTPFYAEKGGQAPDHGLIEGPSGTGYVTDVQSGPKNQPIHQVEVKGVIKLNDVVKAAVNSRKRRLTQKNHSATHLLHSALREILGKQLTQSGSHNDENGLRLDFSFHRPLTEEEITKIQQLVNYHINKQHQAQIIFCPLDEAINRHQALAFFGDKYDKTNVRVVKFGDFSTELCGGTHVSHTKEIEKFLITDVISKGKSTFRVKAITSEETINQFLHQQWESAQKVANSITSSYVKQQAPALQTRELEEALATIKQFKITSENWRELGKLVREAEALSSKYHQKIKASAQLQKLNQFANLTPKLMSNGVNKIEFFTQNLSLQDLKQLANQLRNRHENVIVVLGSKTEKAGFLVVAISPSLVDKYSALDIFRNLPGYHTTGGGNRSLAQGKYESQAVGKKPSN